MFGVLNLDKPADITSRDVVNSVQRIVRPAKVGHAGTLDPMATGVLLVCVGGATRLISLLQQSTKTYLAEFTLGQTSDTDDSTGTVTDGPADQNAVSEEELKKALQLFVGHIEQVPPAYSAVKVRGQRAYTKARRGEDVVLKAKTVTVHRIVLLSFEWPHMTVEIECGSGTYIRSIARDLGQQLGCGALMSRLQRTRIGEFGLETAATPDSLSADNLADLLVDPLRIVAHLPQYRCDGNDEQDLRRGRSLKLDMTRLHNAENDELKQVAITSPDSHQLLAMAEFVEEKNHLQPRMVFAK